MTTLRTSNSYLSKAELRAKLEQLETKVEQLETKVRDTERETSDEIKKFQALNYVLINKNYELEKNNSELRDKIESLERRRDIRGTFYRIDFENVECGDSSRTMIDRDLYRLVCAVQGESNDIPLRIEQELEGKVTHYPAPDDACMCENPECKDNTDRTEKTITEFTITGNETLAERNKKVEQCMDKYSVDKDYYYNGYISGSFNSVFDMGSCCGDDYMATSIQNCFLD